MSTPNINLGPKMYIHGRHDSYQLPIIDCHEFSLLLLNLAPQFREYSPSWQRR